MGQVKSHTVDEQLQTEFIKRTAQIRLPPHPQPCIYELVWPVGGGGPMFLCRRRMMARFLAHRILFAQGLPLPGEVQWLIVAAVYRGDVEAIILGRDARRRPVEPV